MSATTFGRVIKAESGHGSTTVSVVDTVYGPCGCSPMGKMMKVSMPHVPNATAVWTVYTYDALGRTLSVTAPDGSAKTYSYIANTVTATDEAGKWKTYAMDAFGNLATVVEPNPAGGAFSTTYAYDFLNHLTTVTMPRPTGTQTRTFNYLVNGNPGARLMSATNPETGTVTYTYNADGTVATKADAKGQQVQYSYDTYGRMTQVRHYIVNAFQQLQEDPCQQVNLTYDSNSVGGFANLYGRLATRSFKTCMDPNLGSGGALTTSFTEMFSYHQAGAVTTKRLHLERQVTRSTPPYDQVTVGQDLDGTWTYDREGKMNSVTYPTALNSSGDVQYGASYTYGFDPMQRPNTMTDVRNGSAQIVTGVQYGPAGELLSISGQYTESRSYNSRLQLTGLNGVTFNYAAAAANNGKIASEVVSGETISYQYDSLNRLISASSNLGWSQGFNYDGFGNLTAKTALAGTVPTFSAAIDPATNRLIGWNYDANGNQLTNNGAALTYDVENRVLWISTGAGYGYDPDSRRVYRSSWYYSAGTWTPSSEEITYYGLSGQRMASYSLTATADSSGGHMRLVTLNLNVYFGAKLIGKSVNNDGSARTVVVRDRLGSVGKYYPYGEDRGASNPPNGTDKFATYLRDDTTLDYAMNRYFNSVSGRFLTADPYAATKSSVNNPADTTSWNRYGYVLGDPVSFVDPKGLLAAPGYDCYWTEEGWVCDWGPEPAPESPFPQAESRPPNCRINVAFSGSPRDGQNLVGDVGYSPSTNTLGMYSTVGQPGTGPGNQGWFFGVQIQADLNEDNNPNDWVASQTVSLSGNLSVQGLNGQIVTVPVNLPMQPDGPDRSATWQGTIGRFDWIDMPGYPYYVGRGGIIVGASLDFNFTSTLTLRNSNISCAARWSLHLEVHGRFWNFAKN